MMKNIINVLVFPAGEVNSVELHDALSCCVNVHVVGASSVERHGSYVFSDYISDLPNISDDDFLKRFNDIIDERNISVVFSTHDSVAQFLIENQNKLKATVLGGDCNTAQICRDKKAIFELFSDCPFSPRCYHSSDQVDEYPVFVKPRFSQGGVGARMITEAGECESVVFEENVVTEYLPGEEYTVDCLTDHHRELKVISPRSRKRMMAGICVAGKTEVVTDEIHGIAEQINRRLNFKGLWFFQIKKDRAGNFKLMEISVRCSSSMCLTRAAGWNLPLMSVYVAMGMDVDVIGNEYSVEMDRTLISRYKTKFDYDTVYIDFDDTIIMENSVNLNAVFLLYQCRNKGKRIILLTKHEKDLMKTLKEHCISYDLFDDVIHLLPYQKKSEFINNKSSVFIDNSFNERKEVSRVSGIPVFDVSEIDVLLDWRS